MNIKQKIADNFILYDAFLEKYKSDPEIFKLLFSVRTLYAAQIEDLVKLKRLNAGILPTISTFIRFLTKLALFLFIHASLSDEGDAILLGGSPLDAQMSKDMGFTAAHPVIGFGLSAKALKNVFLYPVVIRSARRLLNERKLNRRHAVFTLSYLLDHAAIVQQIDLDKIRTIMAEDDLDPRQATVIQKAKDKGIRTIKIEYYFIDDAHHNNVLCEYYYCPGAFHRRIREKFGINRGLKYLEGGFINWDKLAGYEPRPQTAPKLALYFSEQAQYLDDLFYIDEILSVMPEGYQLGIKIHPRDKYERFAKYRDRKECRLIKHGELPNYELISKASICFSTMSVLSIEAKHICSDSYFINYNQKIPENFLDYDQVKDYFDVIGDKDTLKAVFAGKYRPIEKGKSISYFNAAFPRSGKKLMDLVGGGIKNV